MQKWHREASNTCCNDVMCVEGPPQWPHQRVARATWHRRLLQIKVPRGSGKCVFCCGSCGGGFSRQNWYLSFHRKVKHRNLIHIFYISVRFSAVLASHSINFKRHPGLCRANLRDEHNRGQDLHGCTPLPPLLQTAGRGPTPPHQLPLTSCVVCTDLQN